MTTEIEKTFFDTFGIEPIEFKSCDVGTFCPYPEKECGTDTCPYYKTYAVDYPAISDRILLELICILSTYEWGYHCCYIVRAHNFEKLKEIILKDCIIEYKHIKHQVRTLFEEG
jgi:hypothetical protein